MSRRWVTPKSAGRVTLESQIQPLRTVFTRLACTPKAAQVQAVGRNVIRPAVSTLVRCQGSLEQSVRKPQIGKFGSSSPVWKRPGAAFGAAADAGSVQCPHAASRSSTEYLTLPCFVMCGHRGNRYTSQTRVGVTCHYSCATWHEEHRHLEPPRDARQMDQHVRAGP